MTETLDGHATDVAEQRVRTLQAEVAQLQQRLAIIADMLLDEAIRRDWCSEYDAFVENVNGTIGAEVLRTCARDWVVSFSGTMQLTAKSDEAAYELVAQQFARFESRCDYSVSFETTDAEQV